MRLSHLLIGSIFGLVLTCSAIASAETAQQAFDRGNTLLGSGDFQKALVAYSAAARADDTNRQYTHQFMLVRRVIVLRGSLEQEKDPNRWQQMARSLRAFYVSQAIYGEALSIDQKVHDRLNSAASAAQLAETQLSMNKPSDAEQVLAGLDAKESTPVTQALLSIALARQQQTDAARKIAGKVTHPEKAGPRTLYTLARMHAAVGNHDKALAAITSCLEAAPPSGIDGFRRHARQSPEFTALSSTVGFARALATKSKVPESKCSGGSSCAGCPMSGKCAKDEEK